MAEFLRTSGISHQIEEIIINAKEKLIIVSPYLKLTDNLFERLKEKDSEKIELIFIYGKSELNDNEKRKLHSLQNLSLYYHKNLHAKCYFNESKMLITSMNLYEFSEKNNREMGIFIDKLNDSSIFENAEQESFSILKASVLEKKAALHSQSIIQKSVKDFEYKTEGDISKWIEKVQSILSERYNSSIFKTGSFKPILECESFLADNLALEIEPSSGSMRIVFKFKGKNKKDLFYMVQASGKKKLENLYPEGIVGWGNQMMRIKLDFSSKKFPNLFKYDKDSIIQTIEYITVGGDLISGILNHK